MSFLTRNYGKLFMLVLIVGLVAGAVMARRGVQLDLGTVGGHKLALTTTASAKSAAAAASAAGTQGGFPAAGANSFPATGANGSPSGAGQAITATAPSGVQASGRPVSGTVQSVSGQTITLLGADGASSKATVSDATSYTKNMTVTVGDLQVGDTVTVVGQSGADGTVTAQQLTVGALTQGASGQGFGGGQRAGGAGATGGNGGTATSGGNSGTGGSGRGANAGQFANATIAAGTIQKIDGNTVTIAEQSGQTVTAAIDANTRLRKTDSAKLSDVANGEQVTVVGPAGADGTVAATLVQIGALR